MLQSERKQNLEFRAAFPNHGFNSGDSFYVLINDNSGKPQHDNDLQQEDVIEQQDVEDWLEKEHPALINHLEYIEFDLGVASAYNSDYAAVFHVK